MISDVLKSNSILTTLNLGREEKEQKGTEEIIKGKNDYDNDINK